MGSVTNGGKVCQRGLRYHGQRPGPAHSKVNINIDIVIKDSLLTFCSFFLFFLFFPYRTSLGRARAWIRLALMQKKLADYLKVLIDQRDSILHDYYEPGSLLLSDEAVILLGLLLGLNVVDCNLCLKVHFLSSIIARVILNGI